MKSIREYTLINLTIKTLFFIIFIPGYLYAEYIIFPDHRVLERKHNAWGTQGFFYSKKEGVFMRSRVEFIPFRRNHRNYRVPKMIWKEIKKCKRIIGVDVGKDELVACIIDREKAQRALAESRDIEPEGWIRFIPGAEEEVFQEGDLVIFETTGRYGWRLEEYLVSKNIPYFLVPGRALKIAREQRQNLHKDDQEDSLAMAELALKGEIKLIIPVPPPAKVLRSWIFQKAIFRDEIQRYRNRLEKILTALGIPYDLPKKSVITIEEKLYFYQEEVNKFIPETSLQENLKEEAQFLLSDSYITWVINTQKRINELENKIKEMIRNHKYYSILKDIKGVGDNLAGLLIAFIWDVQRFPDVESLKQYLKLTKQNAIQRSGRSTNRRLKQQNKIPLLKKELYLFLMVRPHIDDRLKPIRELYFERFGHTKKAWARMANKFIERLYYTLREYERGNFQARLKMPYGIVEEG